MDKMIRKTEKEVKKVGKELKGLEKADKKRDKLVDAGKKVMKKQTEVYASRQSRQTVNLLSQDFVVQILQFLNVGLMVQQLAQKISKIFKGRIETFWDCFLQNGLLVIWAFGEVVFTAIVLLGNFQQQAIVRFDQGPFSCMFFYSFGYMQVGIQPFVMGQHGLSPSFQVFMKTYKILTKECVQKLYDCFANVDEGRDFFKNIAAMTEELHFLNEMSNRISDEQLTEKNMVMKMCTVVLFFREHIELVQHLINVLELKTMTEDEMKDMEQK